MVDRAGAEQAARARLEALLAQALPDVEGSARGGAGAADTATEQVLHAEDAASSEAPRAQQPTEPADVVPMPQPPALAPAATWSERLDRWFFGELASLWR